MIATARTLERYAPDPPELPGSPRGEHRLVLLLGGRCPGCAELLGSGAALREEPCARCGSSTAGTGEAPLEAKLQERLKRRLWVILGLVVGAELLVGWFPLLGSAAVVGAAGLHRLLIVDPASAHLGTRRRLVARWTVRLMVGSFLSFTLVLNELLTLLPGIGIVAKAVLAVAQVDLMGWFSTRYIAWQVRREREGRPVAVWEWSLLLCSGLLLAGGTAAFCLAVAWVAQRLGGFLGGLS